MSIPIQTTIDQLSATIVLVAPASVFRTQLEEAIRALHLDVYAAPLEEIVEKREGGELLRHAYLCLWVDMPLFVNQDRKRERLESLLPRFKQYLQIPLHFITFDALHTRKNGRGGADPISTTQWLSEYCRSQINDCRHFDYSHVIYPYEAGISLVQRFLIEKAVAGEGKLVGTATPLWYQDVIEHIVTNLYAREVVGGVFSGSTPVDLGEFEASVYARKHRTLRGERAVVFPFEFPRGVGISTRPLDIIIEELGAVIPSPVSSIPEDVKIQRPVFVKPKPPRVGRKKRSRIFLRPILGILAVLVSTYVLTLLVFFVQFFRVRTELREFVSTQDLATIPSDVPQALSTKIRLLQSINSVVPLPYSLAQIHLKKSQVDLGFSSLGSFFSTLDAMTRVESDLTETLDLQAASTRLDEMHKHLSLFQSEMLDGNITLDVIFGVDGLSTQLAKKSAAYREQLSVHKAIVSLFPTLLGTERKTTTALVTFDTTTSQPLFGIPEDVVVLTIERGKIISTQTYTATELDALLKGRVEVPEEMRMYVAKNQWRLSDGAWSIDGPTASRQIAWFLSKQLHMDIDVLIGMEKHLLSESSSQPDTSNTMGVDSQQGSQKAVLGIHAEQQADRLSLIGVGEEITPPRLFSMLTPGFAAHRAVVYMRDAQAATTLSSLGWDGGIKTPTCPATFSVERECVVSTRYVGEYDLGAPLRTNKKDQLHILRFSEESTQHTDVITYPAVSQAGVTKLLKYAIDGDAHDISVRVNGVEQTDISIASEFSKVTVGVRVPLDTDQETLVELMYRTAAIAPSHSAYAFFAQKQLGADAEPLALEARFERGYYAKIIAPQGLIQRGGVSFSATLDTSKFFAIGF